MEESHITNHLENYYLWQYENALQDDGIERICDIGLHLIVPVMEECIEGNIYQIFDESNALETLNLDSHEGLLMNSFYERDMHVASHFEDVRLQIDHPELRESSEKEEIFLEPLA